MRERAEELEHLGKSRRVAFSLSYIEELLSRWPKDWGDELVVFIYGDFDPPEQDVVYDDLGITVEANRLANTVVKTAQCVLRARVRVADKTYESLQDAATRMNTLLGIWSIIDWGNRGPGWWCALTSPSWSGTSGSFAKEGIAEALEGLNQLPRAIRARVRAAMHWIRTPRLLMMEGYRSETFQAYAGYWNAFECLVEAVCELRPAPKMTAAQKTARIQAFLAEKADDIGPGTIEECYRKIVNTGFVGRASHALQICSPDRAPQYIEECFRASPRSEQLYAVRNAINHGDIDSDSIEENLRVEEKLDRLRLIVFMMLGRLIPFRCPVDPDNSK